MYKCPSRCQPAEDVRGNCPLLQVAYILAGLAMMLNIRLSYSSAPYALIRFRLPENLFSVFVRRMASSLELWCLPGFIIVDIMDLAVKLTIKGIGSTGDNSLKSKQLKFNSIILLSIVAQWLNFITYVILFFVYLAGGDHGRLTTFYWTIAVSGFVFGISNPLVYAVDYNHVPIYIVGENCFPALTSFMHYITSLMFGNRRKYDSDFLIVGIDIIVAILISFVAAIVWTVAYGFCTDADPMCEITYTTEGANYTIKFKYKGTETEKTGKLTTNTLTGTQIGTTPTKWQYTVKDTTSNIRYTFTHTNGTINAGDAITEQPVTIQYGHVFAEGFSGTNANPYMIAPLLIVLVGMGIVYAIYPGIAPGMIVPFYLIDKIEMVLLIATIFPPVIVAILRRTAGWKDPRSPLCEWSPDNSGGDGSFWHIFDLVVPIMIILAYIFIYSLHYRDSSLSRSIVNQPKMSTALSITFYMCHEISLAVGFAGMIGNAAEWTVLAQMIGAFLMVFLALYSEGYIIEYKSHDPAHWPTERMWYLYGYYQLNHDFFIMIKFNVCSDGYCDFK
ncbi:Tpr-related protein family member, putative [Theileria annulata]|uniref:Tpr-related protein family member, putative n=1 Tax=Theileria annulata TaxID=5874 RepID=Q4UIA5_THEAN|nr:Tpr-related protein family member, putative [Theileria annulata]CAI73184.1 Tpr-related protein family member, putative [Theileria annulata]|eukprot:XP_953862.1 Tpr-related protein family member, putative [Theileria annulata]